MTLRHWFQKYIEQNISIYSISGFQYIGNIFIVTLSQNKKCFNLVYISDIAFRKGFKMLLKMLFNLFLWSRWNYLQYFRGNTFKNFNVSKSLPFWWYIFFEIVFPVLENILLARTGVWRTSVIFLNYTVLCELNICKWTKKCLSQDSNLETWRRKWPII